MIVNDIVELVLQGDDLEALRSFYVEAFGLEVLSEEPDRVWLRVGGRTRLGLWSPGRKEHGDEGGRHVHFAMAAAPGRLNDAIDRLRGAGAAVEGPVEHDGGDRSLYVRDPAGNLVELWDYFDRPGNDVEDLAG